MYRHLRRLLLLPLLIASAMLAWPARADAQPVRGGAHIRVARPPIVRSHVRAYRPFSYGPYRRWYWSAAVGWGGWYAVPFWYQRYPHPPYRSYHEYDASARLEVQPRDAQVYVDGYFVGSVDDFDGIFQRLHVRPGEHVLEIYKEGYKTIRERVDFRRGETYKVKYTMEPLAAGEAPEPRPAPAPGATGGRPADAGSDRGPRSTGEPIVRGDGGAVAIRVQPAGAVVIIDGERWDAPNGPDPLVVHLTEGSHRIEVQKEGHRPFTADIRIRRGETVPLNISLR